MSAHASTTYSAKDRINLDGRSKSLYNLLRVGAIVGLAVALLLGFFPADRFRRFYFGYLAILAYFMSISLGSLAFVLLQHVTQAAWSVGVRRIAENIAAALPVLAIASLPILVSVVLQEGDLYRWALPRHAASDEVRAAAAKGEVPEEEESPAQVETKSGVKKIVIPGEEEDPVRKLDVLTYMKRGWLNPFYFLFRVVCYLAVWSGMALYFLHQSTMQDQTGDPQVSLKLRRYSAPSIVLLAVTVSLGAFDLLMSLDPHWYSTMFSVYYIAGCLVSSLAAIIIMLYVLQRNGYLLGSVTIEHYHDLGKFLFAFTFFWGYIAFSQYMLLWYANLPETVVWLARRGVSGARAVPVTGDSWIPVAVLLLFGKLFIPFAGLLSRHIKRRPGVLVFWAVWILIFHLVDMYWVVMPEYGKFKVHLLDLAVFLGLGALFVATIVRYTAAKPLRPTRDPYLEASLAFQNI